MAFSLSLINPILFKFREGLLSYYGHCLKTSPVINLYQSAVAVRVTTAS